MKYKYLIFCLSFAAFLGCKSKNGLTSSEGSGMTTRTPAFEVSPQAKLFLADFAKLESPAQPSDSFVKKYNLQQTDQAYYVSGFIKTDDQLKASELEALGVQSGTQAGNMQTVRIPLKAVDAFFQLKGITYFQLSEKINSK